MSSDDMETVVRATRGVKSRTTNLRIEIRSKRRVRRLSLQAPNSATLFGQPNEVLEQLQANFLAFLRVKLRGEDIIAPDGRSEDFAISRLRSHDGSVGRARKEAVDEIDITAGRDPTEQRTAGLDVLKLVPANLWNLESELVGETNHTALENAKPTAQLLNSSLASNKAWYPTHIPRNGRPDWMNSRAASNSSCFRSALMQSSNAPTPGSTNPRTSPISFGRRTRRTSAPTLLSAL